MLRFKLKQLVLYLIYKHVYSNEHNLTFLVYQIDFYHIQIYRLISLNILVKLCLTFSTVQRKKQSGLTAKSF